MIYPIIFEMNGVIGLIVQPNNYFNPKFLEDWDIVVWGEYSILHDR